MRELYTEVTIEASAERVFEALTDVERYSEWNPFIVYAKGKVAPGETLAIRIHPPGRAEQPYSIQVLRLVPGCEFVWLGHMIVPGILDGTHIFELFPEGANRVRLVHREEFRGLLVPLIWNSFLNTRFRRGFEALNQNLKNLCESPSEKTG
ncbi:MAG: SRPBCC domain-containing protein [Elusimicrobia bacterium]|nr:SRPBCC domain-containing protein [Elusimicrobiota bacterium]